MNKRSVLLIGMVIASSSSAFVADGVAADWPTWRYDASRTAAAPDSLPSQLHLHWTRQLPAPRPAWPASQFKLNFDQSYEPVVLGSRLFVGSSVNDSLTAYDTRTGDEIWRAYTNGPVRFAPVASGTRLFAVSDDGFLYCFSQADGSLVWRVNGGPAERPILGNNRLVSTWSARGGPVLADGVVYFSASIWPSMGIFIHAVDAETGKILWTNSKTGSDYVIHPHGAPSFGSIVPQGYFAVSGDTLVVPGGRSLPAVLDRKTGEVVHFDFGGKTSGGYDAFAGKDFFFVRGEMLRLSDGLRVGTLNADVLGAESVIGKSGPEKIAIVSAAGNIQESESVDRRGNKVKRVRYTPTEKKEFTTREAVGKVFLRAGGRVYTAKGNKLAAYELDAPADAPQPRPSSWSAEIEGTAEVFSMLAADDRLFVVMNDGRLLCYAGAAGDAEKHALVYDESNTPRDAWTEKAAAILANEGTGDGYALALGIGSGRLVDEIIKQSRLHVVVVDRDSNRVDAYRRKMDAAGLYGIRTSAHVGDPLSYPFPPYIANLIVAEEFDPGLDKASNSVRHLFQALRPYGGTAFLRVADSVVPAFRSTVEALALPGAKLGRNGEFATITRAGALPGAANWTHQYADAAQSVVSKDTLVKAPLGVLWYGGPSNDDVLPRHGHGPSPQVAGGRLFIEGPDMLRAVDVYTGRLFWQREFKDLGKYYDNTSHAPGAGEIGSNYISLPDTVYVVYGSKILELSAATGETMKEFELDPDANGKRPTWGYASVMDDLLIATSSPVTFGDTASSRRPARRDPDDDDDPPAQSKAAKSEPKSDATPKREEQPKPEEKKVQQLADAFTPAAYASSSRRLVAFNRHTGKQLWARDAAYSFRHNCLAAGAGKIFCIDGMTLQSLESLRRRGVSTPGRARLWALDAQTGNELWNSDEDVFGTFLNYSVEHDVLLQAGSKARDRARDEIGEGMVAYRGSDGSILWKDLTIKYAGPCLMWRDKIITNDNNGFQLEILTGKRTGWTFSRMYGCNTIIGSQNLLTFRSGAAGFCDMESNSGTSNLGGFRSSCTSNLIVADGVLNAPDYTRTCSCAYQNQTSLAFIHMPEAEIWAFNNRKFDPAIDSRIGVNLGAPGDRRSDEGTLWLEYPSVAGPSPEIEVKAEPQNVRWFQRHSSVLDSDAKLAWVAASGGEGLTSLTIKLPGERSEVRAYTVRLYFADPKDDLQPGQRVFSVKIQDVPVLEAFDIVREAGGASRSIVKEAAGIQIRDELRIALTPETKSELSPVLCGVEIIPEFKR